MLRSGVSIRFAILIVLASGLVFAQNGEPITNDDIVKMAQAQLSTSIIVTTIESANSVKFDLSPAGLIALKDAGVDDRVIEAMMATTRGGGAGETTASTRSAPEKSDLLATANEPEYILRSFKTMMVDASRAKFFGDAELTGALGDNKIFRTLGITIVDDPAVADVVLEVSYTFAWNYPFSLKHLNTSMVLVSGKGSGPFSGAVGAKSVANDLAKLLRSYRVEPAQ
jgi:hypothetical protein